ncbi:hypothetical protein, partial [Kribbia dieselivorans]|uniref:hypothetical protein n=1 Tax=Kribbia dieselivorans TaxID=331526 RepID=UPI0014705BEE
LWLLRARANHAAGATVARDDALLAMQTVAQNLHLALSDEAREFIAATTTSALPTTTSALPTTTGQR